MPEIPVRDIMRPVELILAADTNVRDAQQLLSRRDMSSAPVLDASGRLFGVVTRQSLLAHEAEAKTAGQVGEFFTNVEDYESLGRAPGSASATPVTEAVEPNAASLSPSDSVWEAARRLREQQVHRLFVMERDRLVGVVSCHDLLQVVEGAAP